MYTITGEIRFNHKVITRIILDTECIDGQNIKEILSILINNLDVNKTIQDKDIIYNILQNYSEQMKNASFLYKSNMEFTNVFVQDKKPISVTIKFEGDVNDEKK